MTKSKCSCQWLMESQPIVTYKTGIGFSMLTACFSVWSGCIFSLCTNQMMIFLTGKFLFLECGQKGRLVGTQRLRSGASPLRGSPDWRRDRCWNRHCGRAEGAAGAPRHPAWRSRWPGVPGSLSPGKARRWRVSGGSWSCVLGRDARASSRRLSGPIRCTRSYSFRSLPHRGGSEYLWVGEQKPVPSER